MKCAWMARRSSSPLVPGNQARVIRLVLTYANALRGREALQAARDEALVAANSVRAQLREGQVDSLELLDGERTFAEADAALGDMDGVVVDTQIDLFRALGGSWTGTSA